MSAEMKDGTITVTGNSCPRGEKHAISECTNPVRTLTSTVRVCNREHVRVPVTSAAPVPKEKMMQIMTRIRSACVAAPVNIGDVIVPDVCGTEMIATKEIR